MLFFAPFRTLPDTPFGREGTSFGPRSQGHRLLLHRRIRPQCRPDQAHRGRQRAVGSAARPPAGLTAGLFRFLDEPLFPRPAGGLPRVERRKMPSTWRRSAAARLLRQAPKRDARIGVPECPGCPTSGRSTSATGTCRTVSKTPPIGCPPHHFRFLTDVGVPRRPRQRHANDRQGGLCRSRRAFRSSHVSIAPDGRALWMPRPAAAPGRSSLESSSIQLDARTGDGGGKSGSGSVAHVRLHRPQEIPVGQVHFSTSTKA